MGYKEAQERLENIYFRKQGKERSREEEGFSNLERGYSVNSVTE